MPFTFPQFAALAVEGSEVPVHGLVGPGWFQPTGWVSLGHPPVVVAHGSGDRPLRVWRDGLSIRTEDADGLVRLLADAESVWTFDDDEELPARSPRSALTFAAARGAVLRRPTLAEFVDGPYAAPRADPEPAELVGRTAWRQEFEDGTELVLDAETGWPLRVSGPAGESGWIEFSTGARRPVADFTWTGGFRRYTIPPGPDLAEQERQREAQQVAGLAWFTSTIGEAEHRITAEGRFAISLEWMEETVPGTGALYATLRTAGGKGLGLGLERWVRGEEPRYPLEESSHRWATDGFEWSLAWQDEGLGGFGLAEIAEFLKKFLREVAR